jgi:hypothetical protein
MLIFLVKRVTIFLNCPQPTRLLAISLLRGDMCQTGYVTHIFRSRPCQTDYVTNNFLLNLSRKF